MATQPVGVAVAAEHRQPHAGPHPLRRPRARHRAEHARAGRRTAPPRRARRRRAPGSAGRSSVVGSPATPTQRSRRIDWSMMPSTGSPPRSSAISVPNSGRPVMNDLVPSIGSSTQTSSASGALGAVLLAEDAVGRDSAAGSARASALGLAVGDRHRAGVGLGVDRDRRAEIAALDLAGGIGQRVRDASMRGRRARRPQRGSAARQRLRAVRQRAQVER